MINIICLKSGTKFSPDYVNNLYAGFKRNTTIPFKFYCITENATNLHSDINIIPLPKLNLTGWWNKLWMFSKTFPIEGRLFFVDLDTLILGNVDNILQQPGPFILLKDFYRVLKGFTEPASGVMLFDSRAFPHIWDRFEPTGPQIAQQMHPHGDQTWIARNHNKFEYWQDLFPNQIVSYKVACLNGIPKDARIICFHGKPSIIESFTTTVTAQGRVCKPQQWVKDHWNDQC